MVGFAVELDQLAVPFAARFSKDHGKSVSDVLVEADVRGVTGCPRFVTNTRWMLSE